MADALYAYAVLPDAAMPPLAEPILPGAPIRLLPARGCGVLVSPVPRAPFVPGPECRTDDPEWIAARARAHHGVIAAAAAAGPVLPLAFGALFSGAGPLVEWVAARRERLVAALGHVARCAEWSLSVEEDAEGHAAWLDAHDAGLRDLAASAARSGAGTAFLLGRSRAKRLTEIRAARRAEIAAEISARLERHARAIPAALTALVPEESAAAMRAEVAEIAARLDGTGLTLRLGGPWPPYAYAREALRDAG